MTNDLSPDRIFSGCLCGTDWDIRREAVSMHRESEKK